MINYIQNKIYNVAAIQKINPFMRNVGWFGIAEIFMRVSRLVTAICLAHFLSVEDFGIAAIVLTVYEFIRVFTYNNIGTKILQADNEHLNDVCNSVYKVNWIINIILLMVQCLIAVPMASIYNNSNITIMLIVLSLSYLIYPLSLVHAYLLQRNNKIKINALAMGITTSVDNVLSALLAIIGFGVWSVILPKLLSAPVWVFCCWRHQSWVPSLTVGWKDWKNIFIFAKLVLFTEILKSLRLNLDNLLVGRFLGLDSLGIYYFSRNAGIGISMSLITSYSSALLPHLASARGDKESLKNRYAETLKVCVLILPLIIVLQSMLAPMYVPIVFGQKWVDNGALYVLMILCLSATTRPLAESISQLLRIIDKPDIDLRWNVWFTLLFIVAITIGLKWGLIGVAVSILFVHIIPIPLYAYLTYRSIFHNHNETSTI